MRLSRRALLAGLAASLWPHRLRAQPAAPSGLQVGGSGMAGPVTYFSDTDKTPTTGSSFTYTSFSAGCPNPVIIVCIALNSTTATVSSVACSAGLSSGTPVEIKTQRQTASYVSIWAIPAPTGTGTITVTLSASVPWQSNAMVFSGADQTTPCPTGDATSGTATGTTDTIVLTPSNLTANDASAGCGCNTVAADPLSYSPNETYRNATTTVNLQAGYRHGTGAVTATWSTHSSDKAAVAVRIVAVDGIATTVGGTAAGASSVNGAAVTVTLPTLVEGDVVYCWGGFTNTGVAPGISSPSDFTTLVDQVSGSYRYYLGRKVMGATPDTSLTGINTGNADDGASYNVICLRGVDTTTPEDATPVVATGSGADPDLSSITAATAGAWVLALVGMTSTDVSGITAPTGYTVIVGVAGNDLRDAVTHGAYRGPLSAGAENPGAFSGWATNVGDWVGVTVAVRKSGAGGLAEVIQRIVLSRYAVQRAAAY